MRDLSAVFIQSYGKVYPATGISSSKKQKNRDRSYVSRPYFVAYATGFNYFSAFSAPNSQWWVPGSP